MSSIRKQATTGKLFFDFRVEGVRCREYTMLEDTKGNRKQMERVLSRIEAELSAGTFDYLRYFPNSKRAAQFASGKAAPERTPVAAAVALVLPNAPQSPMPVPFSMPTFKDFAETWYRETEVSWRKSHQRTIRDILDRRLIPEFGEKVVGQITKADIMAFRSTLAKVPGRKSSSLKAKSINAIMTPLRQILNEAADRFEFNTPYRNIKPLKVQKGDIEPFTLEEVQKILGAVRADFANYYTVRFFTGMRTGEIDGLKWKYIDFKSRMILVRESIVAGEQDYTKTDGSQREIQMSGVVYDALVAQAKVSQEKSEYVFCNRAGEPFDHNNITKRVWYPPVKEELTLPEPTAVEEVGKSIDVADDERGKAVAEALVCATRLLVKNDQDLPSTAEELVDAIASSPDPKLTKNALKIAGAPHVFVGAVASYAPAEHKKFPESLESETVFHLRLRKFGDIGSECVTAEFERLHIPGEFVESSVGKLMRHKRRVAINFLYSADEALFKVGAAAQLEIEVKVTATVISSECSICGFTLLSLFSRSDTINKLTSFISQQALPLFPTNGE
jgi:integrase